SRGDSLALRDALPSSWRNGVFAIFTVCGIGIASWMARMPAVKDVLDVNTAQVGILLFGIAVGSITGLLAASHVIASFGSRRTMRSEEHTSELQSRENL